MTDPLASALDRCLRLMLRAAPHPFDADEWHDTIRNASITLDRHEAELSRKSLCRTLRRAAFPLAAGLALIGWLVTPVLAEDTILWFPDQNAKKVDPSVMTLLPSTLPNVTAELIFQNEDLHKSSETRVLDIPGWPGFEVTVRLIVNFNDQAPDQIRVTPPKGFVAVPPMLTVPEGETGRILIYRVEGPSA